MRQQASNLKKLSFTLLTVFLITNVISQISSAAVTRLPQINLSPRTRAAVTEGSICADCATRSPQSSLMQNLAQIQSVQSGTERLFNAAYLADGNDRQSLNALRRRKANGETLTAEENAILVAGNRTGTVVFPNCIDPETNQPINGNAFLVQIEGRDKVMTAAHLTTERSGSIKAGCSLSDLSNAKYMFNGSYYGETGSNAISNEELYLSVNATPDIRFGGFASKNSLEENEDWMILSLDRQISTKIAPDGTRRGFFQFSNHPSTTQFSNGFIIGLDSRQSAGVTTFQKCELVTEEIFTFHACDTDRQSSGSLFGVLENNEIRFQSINNWNSLSLSSEGEHQKPINYKDWNKGLSSEHILDQINSVIKSLPTET